MAGSPALASGGASGGWTAARSAAGEHSPWLITLILSIATFMEVLDTSIANVSLRHIGGSLSATMDESTWVITSYLVANAVILPVSGWLSDFFGRKRFYMTCVALFTISSLLCGMATSLTQLIFFRVLQGIGGGGLVPSEQAMLADTFPPKDRGKAFAMYGIAVVVAPTLGPTVGGWITDTFTWHWVFLINVPVGLVSLYLCAKYIDEPALVKEERRQRRAGGLRVDYVGFGLVAVGLGALEVMLDEGERNDWFASPMIQGFAVLAAVSLVGLVFWEWRVKQPVVDVRLALRRNFGVCLMMMFVVGATLYSTTTLLPMVLQTSHGYTALLAGYVLTPGGFATLTCMPLVGYLTGKVQLRYLMATGLVLLSITTYRLSYFPADLTFATAVWARVAQAVGLGFLFIPLTTLSYQNLPGGKNNVASSMLSVARNIGGSVGIALTSTLMAQRTQFHHARLAEHVSVFDPAARAVIERAGAVMSGGGGAEGVANPQALVMLNGMVTRQAGMMAFNDVAWLLGILVGCMLLLIPLLAPVRAQGGVGH